MMIIITTLTALSTEAEPRRRLEVSLPIRSYKSSLTYVAFDILSKDIALYLKKTFTDIFFCYAFTYLKLEFLQTHQKESILFVFQNCNDDYYHHSKSIVDLGSASVDNVSSR